MIKQKDIKKASLAKKEIKKSNKITKPGDIKKLAKLNIAEWVEELTKAKGK